MTTQIGYFPTSQTGNFPLAWVGNFPMTSIGDFLTPSRPSSTSLCAYNMIPHPPRTQYVRPNERWQLQTGNFVTTQIGNFPTTQTGNFSTASVVNFPIAWIVNLLTFLRSNTRITHPPWPVPVHRLKDWQSLTVNFTTFQIGNLLTSLPGHPHTVSICGSPTD